MEHCPRKCLNAYWKLSRRDDGIRIAVGKHIRDASDDTIAVLGFFEPRQVREAIGPLDYKHFAWRVEQLEWVGGETPEEHLAHSGKYGYTPSGSLEQLKWTGD